MHESLTELMVELTSIQELPCRIEMNLTEKEKGVPKPEEEVAQKRKIFQKELKKQKWHGNKLSIK